MVEIKWSESAKNDFNNIVRMTLKNSYPLIIKENGALI